MFTRFRSLAFTCVLCVAGFVCSAQAGMWTWMHGKDTMPIQYNRGILRVPSPLNEAYPRYAPGFWTDTSGCLWIYGGDSNYDNDLWKFDPVTNMWTWMAGGSAYQAVYGTWGTFDSTYTPGDLQFGMFTWVTPNNHFWVYGGFAVGNNMGPKSLWQYDPAIHQWAQMWSKGSVLPIYGTKGVGDSLNTPGFRDENNVSWVDNDGNLWLIGGHFGTFNGVNFYNDVWKYDVSKSYWIWMSGSNVPNDTGVYAIKGVPSVNCYPKARASNFYWQDNEGNIWIVGGLTYPQWDSILSDVWKFNPQTLEWTWMAGSRDIDLSESEGEPCEENAANHPKAVYENRVVWKYCDDLILTFGGFYMENDTTRTKNELWGYMPTQDKWIKINEGTVAGSYGALGVPSTSNYPPPRYGAVGFVDRQKDMWMFGGNKSLFGKFNDVWKFTLDLSCLPENICDGLSSVSKQEETSGSVQLFPNPASNSITISVPENLIGETVMVTDITGKQMAAVQLQTGNSTLETAAWASGVYLMRVGNAVRKLIVQR